MLFDRSGGHLTQKMGKIVSDQKLNSPHCEKLVDEVRAIWDEWDIQEGKEFQNDNKLKFDSFYNGFMAPYFGCFSCEDTRKGLKAIDMDYDGQIDWYEFLVYIKWALNQYPNLKNVDELLSFAFRKGLIPAMKDEVIGRQVSTRKTRKKKNNRKVTADFKDPDSIGKNGDHK